tara:strand:+ start:4332 stop:5330 length:999 start_codon:yes stop_codon:yes gene_type:complete
MAYLGNKPVNNFVSFAKQDITGNGGTSYSLDYPVTGANDIELYINNVRQEPTEAYSCSGSTLTLTEAVGSSDDIYAIFSGRALQTAQHPSDSALEASQATISGSTVINGAIGVNNSSPSYQVDVTRSTGGTDIMRVKGDAHNAFIRFQDSDSSSDFTVGSDDNGPTGSGSFVIYDRNASSYRLRMDSSGRVTMPYQPFFYAKNTGVGSESGDGITTNPAIFPTATQNIGNCLSNTNSRFTAPIAGRYFFSGNPGYKQINVDFAVRLKINGADVTDLIRFIGSAPDSHSGMAFTAIIYLNASDYVEINMGAAGVHAYHRNNSSVPNWWSGGLL